MTDEHLKNWTKVDQHIQPCSSNMQSEDAASLTASPVTLLLLSAMHARGQTWHGLATRSLDSTLRHAPFWGLLREELYRAVI